MRRFRHRHDITIKCETTTFTGELRLDSMSAPMVLGGPMNGATVRAHAEQVLAPTLGPSNVVMMANLAAHRVVGFRDVIQARGAHLRFLPPYSRDFNPAENAFAKLKATLRRAAARTMPAPCGAIRDALPQFIPTECANYSIAAETREIDDVGRSEAPRVPPRTGPPPMHSPPTCCRPSGRWKQPVRPATAPLPRR
jgi:transposase